MELFDISVLVIILGLVGYIWKLRSFITKLIPGQLDDDLVDAIEGMSEELEIPIDELAKKSRGQLKAKIKAKF